MHEVNEEDLEEDLSAYPIAIMGNSLPDHVVVGLLTTAVDIVREVGRWAPDHDEED